MLSIGVMQERMATPSTWTVQAPQSAMPQPNFVPVMPSTSRNTHRSGVLPSTSTLCVLPLTLIVKAMAFSEALSQDQDRIAPFGDSIHSLGPSGCIVDDQIGLGGVHDEDGQEARGLGSAGVFADAVMVAGQFSEVLACRINRDRAAAKQEAVPYRRALLYKSPRAKAVLELAAEKAGWGQSLPERVGRGVSLQFVFGTYMAQVAEVEVLKYGAVRVRRVVCAVDCGTVVNPDTVQAQIQSAIMFGITAALYGEITLKDGRVEQSNFDTYQVLS